MSDLTTCTATKGTSIHLHSRGAGLAICGARVDRVGPFNRGERIDCRVCRNARDSHERMLQACHTAASEIPSASIDDQLDAVFGIIGSSDFDAYHDEIVATLRSIGGAR